MMFSKNMNKRKYGQAWKKRHWSIFLTKSAVYFYTFINISHELSNKEDKSYYYFWHAVEKCTNTDWTYLCKVRWHISGVLKCGLWRTDNIEKSSQTLDEIENSNTSQQAYRIIRFVFLETFQEYRSQSLRVIMIEIFFSKSHDKLQCVQQQLTNDTAHDEILILERVYYIVL